MNVRNTKTYTVAEATRKLEYYCAYQERCHQEVTKKLKDMGMIPLAIDHIIAHLIQENYLNEERFSQSFARGKFRIKKWGRLRIVRELKARSISEFNIKTALKEIEEEVYLSTLEELIQKRIELTRESNPYKKKQKIVNYLQYRGWESHLIYEYLVELT